MPKVDPLLTGHAPKCFGTVVRPVIHFCVACIRLFTAYLSQGSPTLALALDLASQLAQVSVVVLA
jgi:hypothetical protein